MPPRNPDIKIPKIPIPKDLAKLIAKIMKNDATKYTKAGKTTLSSLRAFEGKMPSKYIASPQSSLKGPSKKVQSLIANQPKVKQMDKFSNTRGLLSSPVGSKPKYSTTSQKAVPSPPKPPKKSVPMPIPARPSRAPSLKGKTLPKTAAEIREADRQARRSIKIASSGDPKPLSKPKSNAKPVDVKGSIVAVPPKASMRPPKPPKGSYEADKTKGIIKGDRELMGRGQKPPRSALSYSEREAIRKAKDAERLAAMKKGPSETARELRKAIDAAKSPKQKKVAQQNLIDFLLRKK